MAGDRPRQTGIQFPHTTRKLTPPDDDDGPLTVLGKWMVGTLFGYDETEAESAEAADKCCHELESKGLPLEKSAATVPGPGPDETTIIYVNVEPDDPCSSGVSFRMHEFGHAIQKRIQGCVGYFFNVMIPSAWSMLTDPDHHAEQPYEKEATELGKKYPVSPR